MKAAEGRRSPEPVTTGPSQRVVYLAPDRTDSAVKKRARGFLEAGHDLLCFSFCRDRYDAGAVPDWPNVDLGRSRERRLGVRILACLRALLILHRHRSVWQSATLVYARNLDLGWLGWLGRMITRCRAPLVYEVLDVHPGLTASGVRGILLRWLERRLLVRCRLLVVSSAAFLTEYFEPRQHFRGPVLLLENKWSQGSFRGLNRQLEYELDEHRPVWTVGWFGNLRCARSLDILTEVADALPDRVRIRLRGCPSLLGPGRLEAVVRSRPNMAYEGEYKAPEDLETIYTGIHFNWCADLLDNLNSVWLLPNRLYEGGYFGVPALAVAGHESGRMVTRRHLGVTLNAASSECLRDCLLRMTPAEYLRLRNEVEARPLADFVSAEDVASLVQQAAAGERGGIPGHVSTLGRA